MKTTLRLLLPLLAAAIATTGCKSRLIFATHSSIGLDVSGTAELPNKVSFSFSRYEAAIVPRKTSGEAHSVYGGMDADVTWFHGHAIRQTFATGDAAKLATGGQQDPLAPTKKKEKDALVFFTGTTYGLKLAVGEDAMPPNLLLGYRRSEAAVIPIPDPAQEVRSVYADIHINTSQDDKLKQITTNFSAIRGTRIKQSFATGKAAENLARVPEVKTKLDEAAGVLSISEFATKGDNEAQIARRLRALSAEKQRRLFAWADATFPAKSGGRLAAGSVDGFLDGFLPILTLEEQQAVLAKLTELEAP